MPQIFNMGAAWDDAMALFRRDRSLVATVFGVFVFLPQLAFAWYFSAAMPQIAPGMPPEAIFSQLLALFKSMLPVILLMLLLSLAANLAVLHLWLGSAGTSVGGALSAAVRNLPVLLLTFLMLAIGGGIAGFILMLPAALLPTALGFLYSIGLIVGLLYLTGRFAPLLPLLVARSPANPVALVRDTWALTAGNGWRCLAFIILIQLPAFVILLLVDAVTSLGGPMFSGLVQAVLQTMLAVLMLAVSAAIYRQLSGTVRADVFA